MPLRDWSLPMEFSVENICGLLIRSRLLSAEEVKTMYQRWQNESRGTSPDAVPFGKWLVANQYVTSYQAQLLARGYADHFFCNQYKILDRLGQGRMAGVYKAVHELGQVVAIKVLPPSKAKDSNLFARFQREARLAQRLNHPNVVRTFQIDEATGIHFIVMEYLEGETLDEVLRRRGKLSGTESARLAIQALLGLQHMFERGMIHRDLKPANLMLIDTQSREGAADTTLQTTLKILDIGLGRAFFDENSAEADLTAENSVLGTPDYLAPEQARDAHSVDIRADIYSVGCVLYHLLTGQPPFPDTNVITQMVRHATEQPRPIRELNANAPEGIQAVLDCMLAKNPAQRFRTPGQAAEALQPFLATKDEASTPAEPDKPMRSYLTWLSSKENAAMPLAAVAASAAELPDATVKDMPIQPAREEPRKSRSKKSKRKQEPSSESANQVGQKPPTSAPMRVEPPRRAAAPTMPSMSTSPPQATSLPDVNVELVQNTPTARLPTRFQLTVRDWLMMAIGAGSVILVGLLGMWLGKR